MNLIKCGDRFATIYCSNQKLDTNGVAEILARHITGGDYTAYLRKIAEKEQERKNAKPQRRIG